jgi:hypothetical protein
LRRCTGTQLCGSTTTRALGALEAGVVQRGCGAAPSAGAATELAVRRSWGLRMRLRGWLDLLLGVGGVVAPAAPAPQMRCTGTWLCGSTTTMALGPLEAGGVQRGCGAAALAGAASKLALSHGMAPGHVWRSSCRGVCGVVAQADAALQLMWHSSC